MLDRPNPIGGVAVAGPMLDAGSESFVGFHRLPVRHGMTVGELARLFQDELKLELDLQVIECEGWRRADAWDATGLTWVNPSPNMRSLTQALLYPGIGLLETTNLSVGRGTDTPFEVIGAPWLDGRKLAAELNARRHRRRQRSCPIEFTPTSSKFANQKCGGVNIVITDRDQFEPLRTGFEIAAQLAHALSRQRGKPKATTGCWATQSTLRRTARRKVGRRNRSRRPRRREEFLKRRREVLLYE